MSRTTITVVNKTGGDLGFATVHYSSTEATSEACVCNLTNNQQFILNQAAGDHSQSLCIAYEIPKGNNNKNPGIWHKELSEKQIPISVVGCNITIELTMDKNSIGSPAFSFVGKETSPIPLDPLIDKTKTLSDYGWYLSETSCPQT